MIAMPTITVQRITKPEIGSTEITFAPNHTTPEQAIAAATEFLLDHVGNQLMAGEPMPMVSALHTLWVVPIYLAYVHTGIVGSVGVVAVEDETARVIAWTPIAQIKTASRKLRESLEPQLSQQFQKHISSSIPSTAETIIA